MKPSLYTLDYAGRPEATEGGLARPQQPADFHRRSGNHRGAFFCPCGVEGHATVTTVESGTREANSQESRFDPCRGQSTLCGAGRKIPIAKTQLDGEQFSREISVRNGKSTRKRLREALCPAPFFSITPTPSYLQPARAKASAGEVCDMLIAVLAQKPHTSMPGVAPV